MAGTPEEQVKDDLAEMLRALADGNYPKAITHCTCLIQMKPCFVQAALPSSPPTVLLPPSRKKKLLHTDGLDRCCQARVTCGLRISTNIYEYL